MSESLNILHPQPQNKLLGLPFPWAITIMAAICMIAFSAVFYSFGVFFKPMANEFGWSRSAVSITLLIRALTATAFVVPAGVLADRYGPRWFLAGSMLLL